MPHQIAQKRLSRTDGHRKALLRNLATSFFKHEKIETTTAKAKEVSKVVERLITTARRGDLHSRRLVASYLTEPKWSQEALRPNRSGAQGPKRRLSRASSKRACVSGDAAEMALLELVR